MDSVFEFIQDQKLNLLIGSTALLTSLFVFTKKFKTNPRLANLRLVRLDEKTIIVTGANCGIGYETALDFATRGARVILGCRDVEKGTHAANLIRQKSQNPNVFAEVLDLASFKSVKEFSNRVFSKYERIDILVNNAGIMSNQRMVTTDGFEYQFQVNYLSHYLLTRNLLDKQAQNGSTCRIVNVTSKLYESAQLDWNDLNFEKDFVPTKGYQRSKLCNILFTNYLKAEKSVNAFSVSPGVVRTNLARYILNDRRALKIVWFLFSPLIWYLLRTPRQGSEASIYCSLQMDLVEDEGFYFRNCEQIPLVPPHATSKEDAAKLWSLSEKMVAQWL